MTVYLVGAGPGDPGLMTVRALELIARADVDPPRPADPAERAGRRPRRTRELHRRRQDRRRRAGPAGGDQRACCVEHGAAPATVVRLKGGDPFVFGRGGEEAQLLRARPASPFEVVPGVTAGVAAPAYAGIPVTHRELASGGRVRHRPRGPGEARVGDRLGRAGRASPARSSSTWASASCRAIAEQLIAGGRAGRRARRGRRARHAARPAHRHRHARRRSPRSPPTPGIRPPAITVVGPVAGLARASSRWLERRGRCSAAPSPSPGRGPRPAGSPRGCATLGAAVVEAPAIRIEPLRRSRCPTGRDYDLVCVTQPQRRRRLLRRAPRDARALAGATSPRSARARRARCARAGSCRRRAAARRRRGAGRGARGRRRVGRACSIARAAEGRDVLPDALRDARRRGRRGGALRHGRRAARPTTPRDAAVAAADY